MKPERSDSNSSLSWSARGPVLVGLVGLMLLLGGFGYWSFTTNIAGAIVASGRIEVDQNQQVVEHPDGGVVAEILVDEGSLVEAGDVLIKLASNDLATKLAIAEKELYELMARRGRLEAERDGTEEIRFDPILQQAASLDIDIADLVYGQERLFVARKQSIAQEIDQQLKRVGQIDSQIVGIDAQKLALATQLDLIRKELTDQESLFERGLAPASRVLSLQREEARLSGTMGDLTARIAESEGRKTEIEIQILKLQSKRREDAITRLRDLRYRELELREETTNIAERIANLEITAPVSGVVHGLNIFSLGAVVKPAEPVLYLVPQDRPLIISARVDPIHVDQMFVGQDVVLRFSAMDQRKTPELTGRVTLVSADAFEEASTNQTYYTAEIALNAGEQKKLPAETPLVPGMPVETFIRTQDRTPIAYLIKPFSDYFAKAFRET